MDPDDVQKPATTGRGERPDMDDGPAEVDRWPTGELILVAGFGAAAFLWAFSERAAFAGPLLPGLAVLLGPVLVLLAGAAMTRRARQAPDAERFLGWLLVVLATPALLVGLYTWLFFVAYWRL